MKKLGITILILLLIVAIVGCVGAFFGWFNFGKVDDVSERPEITALKDQLGDWSITIGSGADVWVIDNNTREITVANIHDKGKGYDFSTIDYSSPVALAEKIKLSASSNVIYFELSFILRDDYIRPNDYYPFFLSGSIEPDGRLVCHVSGTLLAYQNPLAALQDSVIDNNDKVIGAYMINVQFVPDGANNLEINNDTKFLCASLVQYVIPVTVENVN